MEGRMTISNDSNHGPTVGDPWALGMISRLAALCTDERLVMEHLLARIEKGRETYGPMDLANDPRDLAAEAEPEAHDWIIYRSMLAVQRRAR
jgi:hypothetical protein